MINIKREYKRLITEIIAILFNDWDPIGVSSNPNLLDEYDRYAYRVIQMLLKNRSVQDIANLLRSIEEEEIGCTTDEDVLCRVATKLQSLRSSCPYLMQASGRERKA